MIEDTIAEVAHDVLRRNKRPMSIDEILEVIDRERLYEFNTPEPKTVLREQIRRHCTGLDRNLTYEPILFTMKSDGSYEVAMNTSKTKSKSVAIGRRVQRATDKEDMIKLLTQAPNAPFKEIWRLMLFAAALGYRENRRVPLEHIDTGKGIDDRIFSNSPVWPGFLYLLALACTSKSDSLSGSEEKCDQRITLFEEYANGGLAILQEQLETSSYSLDALSHFVASNMDMPDSQSAELSDISI